MPVRSLSEGVVDCARFLDDEMVPFMPVALAWRVPRMERLMPRLRKRKDMTGPRVGRQAETMPADISMAVQPTVGVRE